MSHYWTNAGYAKVNFDPKVLWRGPVRAAQSIGRSVIQGLQGAHIEAAMSNQMKTPELPVANLLDTPAHRSIQFDLSTILSDPDKLEATASVWLENEEALVTSVTPDLIEPSRSQLPDLQQTLSRISDESSKYQAPGESSEDAGKASRSTHPFKRRPRFTADEQAKLREIAQADAEAAQTAPFDSSLAKAIEAWSMSYGLDDAKHELGIQPPAGKMHRAMQASKRVLKRYLDPKKPLGPHR